MYKSHTNIIFVSTITYLSTNKTVSL